VTGMGSVIRLILASEAYENAYWNEEICVAAG